MQPRIERSKHAPVVSDSVSRGDFAPEVLAGFFLNLVLGGVLPALRDPLAGFVADYLAVEARRRLLAGFLSGILGSLILRIDLAQALPLLAPLLPLLAPIPPWQQLGALVLPLVLSLKGALLSAVGGLIGGLAASRSH